MFEGTFGLSGLVHEAHGVFTGGYLGPDGVVPDLAAKLEDGSNAVR